MACTLIIELSVKYLLQGYTNISTTIDDIEHVCRDFNKLIKILLALEIPQNFQTFQIDPLPNDKLENSQHNSRYS